MEISDDEPNMIPRLTMPKHEEFRGFLDEDQLDEFRDKSDRRIILEISRNQQMTCWAAESNIVTRDAVRGLIHRENERRRATVRYAIGVLSLAVGGFFAAFWKRMFGE